MTSLRHNGTHLLGAFVAMGGWAVFANRAHAWPEVMVAGLVQGGLSACITLIMKRQIERMIAALDGLMALFVPPVACGAFSITVLGIVHRLAGTPEPWATIIVPVAVATTYAALYTITLLTSRGTHGPGN